MSYEYLVPSKKQVEEEFGFDFDIISLPTRNELLAEMCMVDDEGRDVTHPQYKVPRPDDVKQKISAAVIAAGSSVGKNNPMYGKSAVKGRKWYHNEEGESFYVFPADALPSYIPGRIHNIGEAIRKNRRSFVGENNPAYGRKFSHTEESKRKISETQRRKYANKQC
mgnify:CR=1 FL=1